MGKLRSLLNLLGRAQQRSYAPAGARWFNPEELTAQKVQCSASALSSPHQLAFVDFPAAAPPGTCFK